MVGFQGLPRELQTQIMCMAFRQIPLQMLRDISHDEAIFCQYRRFFEPAPKPWIRWQEYRAVCDYVNDLRARRIARHLT